MEIVRNMNIPGVKRIEEFTEVATADAAYDPMLQHRREGLDQSVFVTDFSAAPIASVTDIRAYNEVEGLALSEEEIVYLEELAGRLGRPLTDSELFGFCRSIVSTAVTRSSVVPSSSTARSRSARSSL